MKRRILGLFIAICMVMPFIGQLSTEKVFAAEIVDSGTCGKNVTWTLDSDGVLTISGNGAMDDYSWTSSSPFYNNDNIKSANIENGITSIGDFTFYGCSSLTSITIPDSVMSIGGYAFSRCDSLTSITIPDSVTSIEGSAFFGCSSLTSITIPDSVMSIGGYAFSRCDSLTSITIPDSVTRIGEGVFSGCNSLTSITVSDGNTAFDIRDNCNAIIDMATNTLIAGCCNTYIPDSVTSIGDNAFRDCSNMTSIVIPNSVTSIGNYAFAGCSGLTSITIPDGVISIGFSAFSNCNNMTSIVIPNSVTSIGDHAFSWCSNLTSVTIPDSVTSIESGVFYCCYSLTSITLPDSVTSIGYSAFCNCSSLTSITLPISVVSILESAFAVCSNLTDVYYFGDEADKDKISIEGGNETLQSVKWHYMKEADEETTIVDSGTCGEDVTWTLDSDGLLVISGEGDMEDYSWNSSPFNSNDNIKSVEIEDGITSIGDIAFRGCSSLTSVTIPGSVTSIGEDAFSGCSNLTDIYYGGTGVQWNNLGVDLSDTVTVHYSSAEGDAILGDVNGSGDVTADDLTALARYVAKIEIITDTSLLKAADVTSDGDVTADDLTKLARFVAKIITTLE